MRNEVNRALVAKKKLLVLCLLSFSVAVFSPLFAGEIQPSTSLTVYYASIDGTSTNANDDLRKTLCTVISTGYTSIGYSSLQNQMFAASSDPTDFVNGENMTMEDIYSSKPYKSSDNGSSANNCGAGWNKEHTVPQSWFNEQSPMKSDAFHVYPTDIKMNSVRSSYPYGENDAAKSCSTWGYGSLGASTFPGYTGTVFDPGEGGENGSYKGDLARTYFYMVTRYRTTNFTNGSGNTSFTYSGGVANLTPYMCALMLKWHREDPVSEKELKRNNAIYAHQHNRNPFIDYPELVEYIWGTQVGQTVTLAALVSAYDGETPPPGPQPETPKFGVTWSVNGEELTVDSIEQNTNILSLPDTPTSCSTESSVFVGWTTASISGTTDEAPAVLYTKAAQFPAVTEDVTYYAVFAHGEIVEYGPELGDVPFVFDGSGLTFENNGVSVVFATAGGANDPKYYGNGDAIRCYAKNTITVTAEGMVQILFEFGSGDGSNAITPDVGTFNTNAWIGNADEVVFTIGGTSGNRRIHGMTVSRIGSGDDEIYSAYLTDCGDPTDIENHKFETINHKLIIDGHMYILVDDQLFNLQGQRVK